MKNDSLIPKSSDNYADALNCLSLRAPKGCVAILLEKAGLLRFTRNDNYYRWIWVALVTICCLLMAGLSEAAVKTKLMDNIEQAVTKELKSSVSDNAQLTKLRVMKGLDILKSGDDYSIDDLSMTGYNGKNRALFSINLSNRNMEHKKMVVEASYDALSDVFVSSRPLAVGAELTESDFYSVKQKISRLPAGAISDKKDITGKIVKANIGQGIIIKSDFLADHANIKKGQKVKVIIESNSVVVSTQGILKGATEVGGTARVVCDISKKELSGMLISPDTVKVKI